MVVQLKGGLVSVGENFLDKAKRIKKQMGNAEELSNEGSDSLRQVANATVGQNAR